MEVSKGKMFSTIKFPKRKYTAIGEFKICETSINRSKFRIIAMMSTGFHTFVNGTYIGSSKTLFKAIRLADINRKTVRALQGFHILVEAERVVKVEYNGSLINIVTADKYRCRGYDGLTWDMVWSWSGSTFDLIWGVR